MSVGIGKLLLSKVKVLVMFLLSWGYNNKDTQMRPQEAPVVLQSRVSEPEVPCFFVFGDSLSDPGNNNNLKTAAKANYYPYGIDFEGGVATGRFSNNKTFIDVITELLGFDKFIPPFHPNITVAEAINGVNYASGGGGILYESSRRNLGQVIDFYEQIENHKTTISILSGAINLTQCLYVVNIGSDDYINNYFDSPTYPTSQIFTPAQFATLLTTYYRAYLRAIHALGARKIAVYLLTQIGCALGEIASYNATACVTEIDDAVELFNLKLVPIVAELNEELVDVKMIYVNSSAVDVTTKESGITVFDKSCCKTRSDGQCEVGGEVCGNRSLYYFWDLYHPTDAAVEVLGRKAYKANSTAQAYPYDISTLVGL